MPVPASMEIQAGRFQLQPSFTVSLRGADSPRLLPALQRALWRLDRRTGLRRGKSVQVSESAKTSWVVKTQESAKLELGEDESYSLQITPGQINLEAQTDLGALHGVETLLQLLSADSTGWYFPCVTIKDQPRFPWRGLLIDVCRHFMPMEVIKRNLDGMALVKMNVLHLHLSEDQGFRVESKKFPELTRLGSNGDYFTQDQIREIIEYANLRGIRVVPEFDIPGHATSWLVSHPELASAPGPYQIEKGFGVFDPTFDPSKEETYTFFQTFFTEMAALFPDAYLHIGGDENNGKQWDGNPKIQTFKKKNGLKDNHELQRYFNERIQKILTQNGKRMVGWDEILVEGISKDIVIQSWRGKEALAQAAKNGYQVMLSNGWYIDLCQPASYHYLNDPLPADLGLSEAEQKNVLGGEATMWAELVTPENVDTRIWPRTAAIAERLWSPAAVTSVNDMYRRLEGVSLRLEETGLTHLKNREMMLRRITNGQEIYPLASLLNYVEPLKIYQRHAQGIPYSTDLSLTRLPDVAIPDPKAVRDFNDLVDLYFTNPTPLGVKILTRELGNMERIHTQLTWQARQAPALLEILPMSEKLQNLARKGMEALNFIDHKTKPEAAWKQEALNTLAEAKKPVAESELAVILSIEKLIYRTLGP